MALKDGIKMFPHAPDAILRVKRKSTMSMPSKSSMRSTPARWCQLSRRLVLNNRQ